MGIYLFLYIVLCFVASWWASSWNKSGVGYFLLAFVLSPLVAFAVILITGQDSQNISVEHNRKCPFCAETIKAEAKLCRFCQKEVEPVSPEQLDSGVKYHGQISETTKCNMCANYALENEIFCPDHIEYSPNAKKYLKS